MKTAIHISSKQYCNSNDFLLTLLVLKLTLEAKSTYLLSPGLMTWFHCNVTPSGLLHLSCFQSGFEDPTPYRYLLTCCGDRRL